MLMSRCYDFSMLHLLCYFVQDLFLMLCVGARSCVGLFLETEYAGRKGRTGDELQASSEQNL